MIFFFQKIWLRWLSLIGTMKVAPPVWMLYSAACEVDGMDTASICGWMTVLNAVDQLPQQYLKALKNC